MMLRRVLSYVLFLAVAAFSHLLPAQSLGPNTGTPAFGTFGGGPDVINLGNLNVHWSIPLAQKAGRGPDFNYSLTYDSMVWASISLDEGPDAGNSYSVPSSAGWQGVGPAGGGAVFTYSMTLEANCLYVGQAAGIQYSNFTYIDSVGNSHYFSSSPNEGPPVYTTDDCSTFTTTGFPAYATDGSGILLRCDGCAQVNPYMANVPSPLQYTIVLPNGQIIPNSALTGAPGAPTGLTAAIDSNGNYISYQNAMAVPPGSPASNSEDILQDYTIGTPGYQGSIIFTDTLGQQVMTSSVQNSGSSTAATVTVNALGSNYIINMGAYTLDAPGTDPNSNDEYETAPLVSQIQLPDGRSYTFGYEAASAGNVKVTGRVNSVTLPQGGSITYQYGPPDTADNSLMSLTRTVSDGKGNSYQWTYQRTWLAASSQWQTLVTDPVGNQTAYLFIGQPPTGSSSAQTMIYQGYLEQGRTVYSGPASNNAVLLATTTQYTYNTASSNSIASKQVFLSPNGGPLTSSTLNKYNEYGLPSETDVYDFGTASGQPGPLLSKTVTTYAVDGDLLNRPSSVISYDGQGNVLSSATYGYDETAVVATSGTPNQVAPTNARGNLTSFSNGVVAAQMTYLDTGEVHQISNGLQTTMSYMCGGAYPSGTTAPTGSVTFTTQTSWNCVGGVPVSQTDVNGNTITTAYADPYWRPTSTTDSLGNTTTMSYPALGSNTSEVSETFNGGQSISDVLTTYDGLGRAILSQARQAPGANSFASVAQTFDPRGLPLWTSLPYVAAAGVYTPAGNGSTSTYDALGRMSQTTDAGGGWTTYSYNQNDTLVTAGPQVPGESLKSRQLESNGAGQLTSVCEITSGTASGPCGQKTAANGYLTQYTYDGGNLTGIAQNVQAGAAATQRRAFTYGWGSKLSESGPETGLTTYSYDEYGNLSASTDNMGNVTSYTYDFLRRPLSSTVISGPYAANTPQTHFVYDTATLGSTAMQNVMGSVAEAYTCTGACSTKLTDIYYSSSAEVVGGVRTGRTVSQMWESTPHSNGYVLTQAASYPNGAVGSVSASLNGSAIGVPAVTYGIDAMGRPITATDTTHSLNLVTNSTYNVAGGVTGVTYGNGDSDSFGFDPMTYRQTGFGSTIAASTTINVGGTLTWNLNGSLNNFTLTDSSDATKDQNCGYHMDDLNRLASVNCAASWAQSFTYDPFGNIQKGAPANPGQNQITSTYAPTYSSQTNQVTANATAQYDLDGNQTLGNAIQMSWNANSQPVVINGTGAMYDAAGRLVEIGDAIAAIPATASTGTISLQGSEQSVPGGVNDQATATVTINGSTLKSESFNPSVNPHPTGCGVVVDTSSTTGTCYDIGGGSIAINIIRLSTGQSLGGETFTFSYGQPTDTPTSIAGAIAASINGSTATSGVSATSSAGAVTLTMKGVYPSTVGFLVSGGVGCTGLFSPCSFSETPPSGMIVGSQTGTTPPVYDSGTMTAQIANLPIAQYTWSSSDTPATIAAGLAAAIATADSSSVTAVAVIPPQGQFAAPLVQVSSKATGFGIDWPITFATTYNTAAFRTASFSGWTTNVAGGYTAVAGATGSGTSTQFIYSPTGAKLAAVQNGSVLAAEVPLPGGATAMYNASGLNYLRHADWLGSSRLATTWQHTVYSKTAYAPFGETYNQAGTTDLSFTGQDQDPSSSDFNFLFRKYDPIAGRWLSPDPSGLASADLTDPQSLNLYAYVLNNSVALTDGNGLDPCLGPGYIGADCSEYYPPAVFTIDDYYEANHNFLGQAYASYENYVSSGSWTTTDNSTWDAATNTLTGYIGSQSINSFSFDPDIAPGIAPSNTTPWYKSCTAQALGSGALSIGADALGFIPGEKDVQAAVEIGSGTVARQIGNWNGYRGIVADQFGARYIAGASQTAKAGGLGYSLASGGASGDWISLGLNAAGLIPGLNEVAAVASIGYDAYKTVKAVAKCP